MATAKTVTLSSGTAQSVTVDCSAFGGNSGVQVISLGDGTVPVWVRTDGQAAQVAQDNNTPVFGSGIFASKDGYSTMTVSVVANGAFQVCVSGAVS